MKKPKEFPEQKQTQPGSESNMNPEPEVIRQNYQGSGKLKDKVAIITGGDSGIGRSVAVHFAREGADVAIVFLKETNDAKATKKMVEKEGRRCLLIKTDLRLSSNCTKSVNKCLKKFGNWPKKRFVSMVLHPDQFGRL